jgi:hypothetical protein
VCFIQQFGELDGRCAKLVVHSYGRRQSQGLEFEGLDGGNDPYTPFPFVQALEFSPDGSLLAAAGGSGANELGGIVV